MGVVHANAPMPLAAPLTVCCGSLRCRRTLYEGGFDGAPCPYRNGENASSASHRQRTGAG